MVTFSVTAHCDCLVPGNNSLTLNRDDFLAVFSDSVAPDLDDNFAALNQAISLLNVSFTRTQLAAFLGTIRSNTENLRRHHARCADTDSCPVQYDQICSNNRTMDDRRHFYPRSALMISYQCNYADLDAVLRSSLPCLRSIESEPDLLSDRLLYSYLASVAAWINTECMSLTSETLDQFGICMNILNPFLCTSQGQDDQRDLITSINHSLLAFNLTHLRLPDQISSCSPSINISNVTYPDPSSNITTDKINVTYTDASNITTSCNMSLMNISNMTKTSSSSSSDSIGMLTRDLFRSYFNNVSVVDDHYNALIGSLLLANIHQLDTQQTALILAAIKTKTEDLSRTDPAVSIKKRDETEFPIAVVTRLLSSPAPSINPDLVMFYISFTNDLVTRSHCMSDLSQGLYDLCLYALFPLSSCTTDRQGHDQIEADVKRALILMNADSDLTSLQCQDEVTSHAFVSSSPISSICLTTVILAVGLSVLV